MLWNSIGVINHKHIWGDPPFRLTLQKDRQVFLEYFFDMVRWCCNHHSQVPFLHLFGVLTGQLVNNIPTLDGIGIWAQTCSANISGKPAAGIYYYVKHKFQGIFSKNPDLGPEMFRYPVLVQIAQSRPPNSKHPTETMGFALITTGWLCLMLWGGGCI